MTDIKSSGWFNAEQASEFLTTYDKAKLAKRPFTRPNGLPEHVRKVYCSTLPRSVETAKMLFGDKVEIVQDAAFIEFERRTFKLPWVKFPIAVWLIIARILWFLGFNNLGIETFKQARGRAARCARALAEHAEKEGVVILIGHGLLNAFIRRALKRQGWVEMQHTGFSHLGFTELEKR